MGSEKDTSTEVAVDFTHPCAGHVKILSHEHGIVESYCPDGTKREKLAIIGFAASSIDLAPYNDPSWEICGLNQLYRKIPRADRWFEIHHNWDQHVVEGTDHAKWLAEAPIPIYMVDCVPGIPNSVRYPIERVMDGHLDYFTSTVAFGIALAIADGFKEIGLWGIDLLVGDEYFYQKACAEFWLGVAHGKGIKVTLPHTTALCTQSHRYGYQSEPDSLIRMTELMRRRKGLMDEKEAAFKKLYMLDGALQENDMWTKLADLRSKGGTVNP